MSKEKRVVNKFVWSGDVLQVQTREGKVLKSFDYKALIDVTFNEHPFGDGPLSATQAHARHGFQQRISDARDEASEVYDSMLKGEWYRDREGIARPPEAIVQFIMEAKKVSREIAVASLKKIGKEGWDAINEKNKAAIDKIREKIAAAEAVSLDDLA